FGTLFARSILARKLPPLEARLVEEEMRTVGADEELYRALALCCWLDHLRLRRDSWLVRSPSWLDQNLHEAVEAVRRSLCRPRGRPRPLRHRAPQAELPRHLLPRARADRGAGERHPPRPPARRRAPRPRLPPRRARARLPAAAPGRLLRPVTGPREPRDPPPR